MADPTPAEQAEDWPSIGGQVASGVLDFLLKSEAGKFILANLTDIFGLLLATGMKATIPIGIGLAKGIAEAEDMLAPEMAEIAAAAVSDAFGTDVSPSTFAAKRNRGGRTSAAEALGRGILETIRGQGAALEPSEAGASRYLGMVLNMALEGWYQGWFFEFASSLVPQFDVGKIESFADLDDTLAQALGLGRLSRRVLSPLIDATVVTPFEWHINRTYRHKLLSAGEVARQVARGRMTREAALEELARQGYSNERIEALLNAAAKFHSVSDLYLLVQAGLWTKGEAVQHLRDQGYEEPLAENEFLLEKLRRIAAFERKLADAALDAYADGRISRAECAQWLGGSTLDSQESAQLLELADARRSLRVKPLTASEARSLVRDGILSVIDYRRALEREGRDEEAILALELALRKELEEKREIEDLRAEQQRERAAEQQAREEARAAARAAAEEARRLARRGREADLERAVVRGRIPIARYVEVISQQFDADTVAIMVADVEDQRQAYLAEQRRKAAAEQRATLKRIDVGAVRAAVLQGVLTLDEFRRHPALQLLAPADRDILARTLEAELADRQLAETRRRDAQTDAKARGIDLARYAQLVRRGIRTLDDYRARVAELGYGPADVDAITELLEQELAEDAAERQARAAAESQVRERGLSLEQVRRAVLAGDRTLADFEAFLQAQRFTQDAQLTLIAGLRRELAEVESARAREVATEPPVGSPDLPLSVLERAARLGIISPSDYRDRLLARGFDELDAEVYVELLLHAISETQRARGLRDQIEAEPAGVGLTLLELRRAVKAGIKSIEDYRAALIVAGKTQDAVETLVALLEDELAETKAAEERRARIAGRLAGAGVDLDALEGEVLAGARSVDSYIAELAAAGVEPVETGLLVGLLVAQLETA